MSNKLLNDAMALNESGSVRIDENPTAWAQRAFSLIVALGSLEGSMDEEATDAFSKLLAAAPDEVLMGGTIMIMQAAAYAATLEGNE